MTRMELIRKERARARAYSYVFWIAAYALLGAIVAVPWRICPPLWAHSQEIPGWFR